jgi:hypothetical protein
MLLFRPGFWLACSLVVVLGCNGASQPLSPPRPEAERRADERERIAQDFQQLAQFYKAYSAETKEPTTSGFWKYLAAQEQARGICMCIKVQRYVIQVPGGWTNIVGYEMDSDLHNTRVVVLADGTVDKAMPEAKFQEAIVKERR